MLAPPLPDMFYIGVGKRKNAEFDFGSPEIQVQFQREAKRTFIEKDSRKRHADTLEDACKRSRHDSLLDWEKQIPASPVIAEMNDDDDVDEATSKKSGYPLSAPSFFF